jgi:hypothetical protein
MSKRAIKRYEAEHLVQARKVAGKIKSLASADVPLLFDIRKVDSPFIDLELALGSWLIPTPPSGLPSVRRPSVSLLWHGQRIRGINWTIKHEVLRDGIPPVSQYVVGMNTTGQTTNAEKPFVLLASSHRILTCLHF